MRLRLFPTLALITALLTVVLIVLGGVVRVTDSGLGCGDHWPLCNGTIFPSLDNITAWIEWMHRLLALLIGLFGLASLIVASRDYRKHKRGVLVATIAAAALYSVQDLLGRAVVLNELNPVLVTVHLATAMLLLGFLVVAAALSRYVPKKHYAPDRFTSLALITAALSFVIILTGAFVRGSGATLACLTWPACNGQIFPSDQGTLAILALVAYLCQAGVGAMVVFSRAEDIWGAAHVGFAAVTWALLIVLCVIETSNTAKRLESEWQAQPEPLPN
jgi:heme A synthase